MLILISDSMDRPIECPFQKVAYFKKANFKINLRFFKQIQGIFNIRNWSIDDDLLPSYTLKQKFKVNAKYFTKLPKTNKKTLLCDFYMLGEKK
jgi:hypothetical protein